MTTITIIEVVQPTITKDGKTIDSIEVITVNVTKPKKPTAKPNETVILIETVETVTKRPLIDENTVIITEEIVETTTVETKKPTPAVDIILTEEIIIPSKNASLPNKT